MTDKDGVIYDGRSGMDPHLAEMARLTNPERRRGTLADVIAGADVFIGASAPGVLTQDMVRSMAAGPIVFACANPTPEIMPDEAIAAGAAVVATGRSDFPNQINNALAFPGIFRGALDVRARDINDAMKLAAADALAEVARADGLSADHVIPEAFDPRARCRGHRRRRRCARDGGGTPLTTARDAFARAPRPSSGMYTAPALYFESAPHPLTGREVVPSRAAYSP